MTEHLKPKFVVLLGLKTLLKDPELTSWLRASGHWRFNFTRPEIEIPFEAYKEKRLTYGAWRYAHGLVVSWPQHPSRSPFSNADLWSASITEGSRKLLGIAG